MRDDGLPKDVLVGKLTKTSRLRFAGARSRKLLHVMPSTARLPSARSAEDEELALKGTGWDR
jgi:hypothetical protein